MENDKLNVIVCKNCGKENSANTKLCGECGTLLNCGFINCYITMWKRIFDFKGRSSVKEFVKAYFLNVILFTVLYAVSIYLMFIYNVNFEIILTILAVIFVLSQLAVASLTVRKLHDAGKSGWWVLLSLIAVLGNIVLYIACCMWATALITLPMVQGVYGPPNES